MRHYASQALLGAAVAVVLDTWPSLRLGGWAMTFVSKRVGKPERAKEQAAPRPPCNPGKQGQEVRPDPHSNFFGRGGDQYDCMEGGTASLVSELP